MTFEFSPQLTLGDLGYTDHAEWLDPTCENCKEDFDKENCPIVESDYDGKHYATCPHCGHHDPDQQHAIEDSTIVDMP